MDISGWTTIDFITLGWLLQTEYKWYSHQNKQRGYGLQHHYNKWGAGLAELYSTEELFLGL
jgi:hypothetical protein